jgi:predicted PurR-regulated permease PerM
MNMTNYVSIKASTIIKIIVICALAWGLFFIRDFILVLLVAIVLASATEPPVRFFSKFGIPRVVSVGGLFLLLLAIIVSVSFIFIPPLADDFARFVQTLPKILESIRIFGRDLGFKDMAASVAELSRDISKGQILTMLKESIFGTSGFFATTSIVVQGVFNLVITFVLAFYIALEENGVHKVLRLFSPKHMHAYVEDLWNRAQRKISLWMQGQLLLSLLVALLIYVPMLVINMPYAALLAVLAFVGELIPVVGLTIATIPALFIAWSHGGLPFLGIVALIYFIVSQLENHVLYPKVMNKMVGVPSVIVLISLIIGAKFAGLWGVVLAVPLASIMMELVSDIEKRKDHEHA